MKLTHTHIYIYIYVYMETGMEYDILNDMETRIIMRDKVKCFSWIFPCFSGAKVRSIEMRFFSRQCNRSTF